MEISIRPAVSELVKSVKNSLVDFSIDIVADLYYTNNTAVHVVIILQRKQYDL